MADWFGARRNVKWRYMRVDWHTWDEVGEYSTVTSGNSEESYFTSIKGGGSLAFVGGPPSTYDLVRVYYDFTDDRGESVHEAVCTMLVDMADVTIGEDGTESGEATLYSVLKVADDRLCGFPLTIPANTKAVEYAANMLSNLGLNVSASNSEYTTATAHTFKPDDTYLNVINWLLSVAGFGSASPDAYGTVVLAPYVDATSREPVFTFVDDERSIMYPQVMDSTNYGETPNVVRMYSEDEYGGYWAIARNTNPDSPASLPNRGGRERTLYVEVTQLEPAYNPSDSASVTESKKNQRVAALVEQAKQKLIDNSSEIEYVTIRHGYYPLIQGDSVEIRYTDRTWRGTVTNVKRDHVSESGCELKIRRFVMRDLEPEIESGVIR